MPLNAKIREVLQLLIKYGPHNFIDSTHDIRAHYSKMSITSEDRDLLEEVLSEFERLEKAKEIEAVRMRLRSLEVAYEKLLPSSSTSPSNSVIEDSRPPVHPAFAK